MDELEALTTVINLPLEKKLELDVTVEGLSVIDLDFLYSEAERIAKGARKYNAKATKDKILGFNDRILVRAAYISLYGLPSSN
ncbi:MAG: hypothetical protein ACE5ES_00670 [Candidatus Nanoarchaeia archaeon]